MGGTCGDLIAAILDPAGCELGDNGNVKLSPLRSCLKKPHKFNNNQEKDLYLETQHSSITSHDLDYHILRKHEIIGITVNTIDYAEWAANRFKQLHRPHVWQQVMQSSGIKDTHEYARMMLDFSNLVVEYTRNVLSLEDILAGNTINRLQELTGGIVNNDSLEFYKRWLNAQTKYETMFNKSFRRSQY